MADLLDMGRHSVFIWTSYGIVFGLLITLGIRSFAGQKTEARKIEQLKSARKTIGEKGDA